MVPEPTIGRLSLYRRLLDGLLTEGVSHTFSHELASMAGGSAVQVRRDMMAIGFSGTPSRGYDVKELAACIVGFLDAPEMQKAALVGVGNLGRAIMAFFAGRRPNLAIVAGFDVDPQKADRTIHGCRCHSIDVLDEQIAREEIRVAVIAVPATEAQAIADRLVEAGVKGILNFAPIPLRVPADVFVEQIDMTMSLEKVAFFARKGFDATPHRRRK